VRSTFDRLPETHLVDSARWSAGRQSRTSTEARSHDCERCAPGPRGRPVRHDPTQVSSPYVNSWLTIPIEATIHVPGGAIKPTRQKHYDMLESQAVAQTTLADGTDISWRVFLLALANR